MSRGYSHVLAVLWMWGVVPAFALIERKEERRFEVPANAVLNVDTFSGGVRILEQAEGKTIEVVVNKSAEIDSEKEMDARLEPLELSLSQQDGTVSVTARYRRAATWSWKAWPPVTLTYEIKVPKHCDVQVNTREGSIVVGSLQGSVVLNNESGNIFTGEIHGPVTARSKSGEVAITAATGAVEVSTVSGNITVGRAGGRTQLASSGGFIELQQAGGEVVVRGNGSYARVGFASPIRHPADIVVSGGELTLVMDNDSVCTLDARSSVFGKVAVRGGLPVKVTAGGADRIRLEGTVNGGGPLITARAGGGNIVLRGMEPLSAVPPAGPDAPPAR